MAKSKLVQANEKIAEGVVCPQKCIDFASTPAVIEKEHCLHCGDCMEICPQNAVIREGKR